MGRKDHLITPEEDNRTARRKLKKVTSTAYLSAPPVLTQSIDTVGLVSRTTSEVRDTAFPVLHDLNDLSGTKSSEYTIDLSLPNTMFNRILIADVDDDSNPITNILITFTNLPTNKELQYTLQFTKDPAIVTVPTITFSPPLENTPDDFPDDFDIYYFLISALDTPNQTRYQVINTGTGSSTQINFPILYPEENIGDVGNATIVIDISGDTGQFKELTLTGDLVITFTGDPSATVLQNFWLIINQDATGGWNLSGPTNLKNQGLLNNNLDHDANSQTMFELATGDGGVTYHAELIDLDVGQEGFSGLLSDLTINVDKNWAGFGITDLAGINLYTTIPNAVVDASEITFVSATRVDRGQFGASDTIAGINTGVGVSIPTNNNFSIVTNDGAETPTTNVVFTYSDSDSKFIFSKNIDLENNALLDIGYIEFTTINFTPTASFAIYTDGTDLYAHTSGTIINLGNYPWTQLDFTSSKIGDIADASLVGAANTVIKRNAAATLWVSGNIVNDNIDAGAAIDGSKINMALGELNDVGTTSSANTVLKTLDGSSWGGGNILDNNVDAGAAIAGSKIDMALGELNNVGTTTSVNTVLKTVDGINWGGGNIVNDNVDESAAIEWSKINKSGSVLTDIGDVSAVGSIYTVLQRNAAGDSWISKFVDNNNVSAALITGFDDIATVDSTNDRLLIWDASETALRKVAPSDIGGGSSGKTNELGDLGTVAVDFNTYDDRQLYGNQTTTDGVLTFTNIPSQLSMNLKIYITPTTTADSLTVGGNDIYSSSTDPFEIKPLVTNDFLLIEIESNDQSTINIISVSKNGEAAVVGPGTPGNIYAISNNSTSATLSWDQPLTGILPITYDIAWSTSSAGDATNGPTTPATGSPITDIVENLEEIGSLISSTIYYFWVRGVSALGTPGAFKAVRPGVKTMDETPLKESTVEATNGDYAGPEGINTRGTTNPGNTNFAVNVGTYGKATVTWDDVAGSIYSAYRTDSDGVSNEVTFVTRTAGAGNYVDTLSLEPDTEYKWTLESYNEFNIQLGTATITSTTAPIPTPVFTLSNTGQKLNFNITFAAYTSLAIVEYALDSGFTSGLVTQTVARNLGDWTVSSAQIYTTNSLNPATTYYGRVLFQVNQVDGPYAATQNVTTSSLATPSQPELDDFSISGQDFGLVKIQIDFTDGSSLQETGYITVRDSGSSGAYTSYPGFALSRDNPPIDDLDPTDENQIRVVRGGGGWGAVATITVVSGAITVIDISSGGQDYTNGEAVYIYDDDDSSYRDFAGTAIANGAGQLTGVNISNGGDFFTNGNQVFIYGYANDSLWFAGNTLNFRGVASNASGESNSDTALNETIGSSSS